MFRSPSTMLQSLAAILGFPSRAGASIRAWPGFPQSKPKHPRRRIYGRRANGSRIAKRPLYKGSAQAKRATRRGGNPAAQNWR